MLVSNATEWQMTKEEFLSRLGLPGEADVYHVKFREDGIVEVSAHASKEFINDH